MIKRLFLITALLISVTSLLHAGTRGIPTGKGDQLASADYGGVDIASTTLLALSSANVLIFAGEGVFQGLIVDSFTVADIGTQIIIRDTNSVVNNDGSGGYEKTDDRLIVRLSTLATSVPMNPSYTFDSGFNVTNWQWKPNYPIRLNRGLVVKCSTALIGRIRALYTKFE